VRRVKAIANYYSSEFGCATSFFEVYDRVYRKNEYWWARWAETELMAQHEADQMEWKTTGGE